MNEIEYVQMDVPPPLNQTAQQCGTRSYKTSNGCSVIVSSREYGRWHLSIAHPRRYPTWDEIKDARYRLVPDDVHMVMALPPKKFYLNLHPNAFHLWELMELSLREIIEHQ